MGKNRIEVIEGDITTVQTDAIVNAANSTLLGGGGVDGAIHRKGGKEILEACKQIIEKIGRCETGNAVITTAGNLPAKYVIHTVGPVWHGGSNHEEEKLRLCYINSLQLAVENNCRSIAFPNISTGVYHFPKDKAAKIAAAAVVAFLSQNSFLEKVVFCCFERENALLMRNALSESEKK